MEVDREESIVIERSPVILALQPVVEFAAHPIQTLSEPEQQRLDALLRGASRLHFAGFVVAGAVVVAQTCGGAYGPFAALPEPMASVGLLVVLMLAIAADRLFLTQDKGGPKENKGPRVFLSLQ